MTDNRTSEPTHEQVETAAVASINSHRSRAGLPTLATLDGVPNADEWRDDARAALVAAQGAAPQAESAQPWNDPSDPNSPQFDSPWEKAAALIQSIRGAQWDMLERRDQADVRDEINGLIDRLDELATTMLAAPVLPSSGVDEIDRAIGSVLFNVTNFPARVQALLPGQDMAPLREKLTRAVVEAIGGEGR